MARRLFWAPVFAEWFRDPFRNISSRYTVGYELVETSRIDWKVETGLTYQNTSFESVADAEGIVPEPDDHRLITSLGFEF